MPVKAMFCSTNSEKNKKKTNMLFCQFLADVSTCSKHSKDMLMQK